MQRDISRRLVSTAQVDLDVREHRPGRFDDASCPDGILQHSDTYVVVADDLEVVWCVQLSRVRVLRFKGPERLR